MIVPAFRRIDLTTPDGAHIYGLELGDGPIPILLIPGAGDGLATAREAALNLAWYLRRRRCDFRILYLSRREPIPSGYTMEQHAEDYLWAMQKEGWGPTLLECNSGGGPIGQWIAVKRPDLIRGLILSCTLHRTDAQTHRVLGDWYAMAEKHRWSEFNWSSVEHTFRPKTVTRYRLFRPLLGLIRPKSAERILRIFEGLMTLDNRSILPQIACPTLVIGGEDDRVIPAEIQREMAELIPHSRLKLYPCYGHGNDQENPEYERELRRFAQEVWTGHGGPSIRP